MLPTVATKLIPKGVSKSCPEISSQKAPSKAAPRIAAPHSCSRKLFTKLLPKAVPEICSPKLVPEAVPKNAPESNTPKLSKVATENCSLKFLVNLCPKAAVLQSKCSSKLFWKVVQSCSPQAVPEALLPKVVPQSCCPKLLPQSCDSSNL